MNQDSQNPKSKSKYKSLSDAHSVSSNSLSDYLRNLDGESTRKITDFNSIKRNRVGGSE